MFVTITGTDTVQLVTASRSEQMENRPLFTAAADLSTSEKLHHSKNNTINTER
jgi:hypothetical protein